jgi:hypothetical protein
LPSVALHGKPEQDERLAASMAAEDLVLQIASATSKLLTQAYRPDSISTGQHIYRTAYLPGSISTEQYIYQTVYLPDSISTGQHIYQTVYLPDSISTDNIPNPCSQPLLEGWADTRACPSA